MLEQRDIDQIRGIVRLETEAVVKQHLYALTAGCLGPMATAIAELQKSAGLLVDGQALIEKHLAGAFDDGDEWRQSLGPDSE